MTIHNLHFYQELMAGIRQAIEADNYPTYAARVSGRWTAGEQARLDAVKAKGKGR